MNTESTHNDRGQDTLTTAREATEQRTPRTATPQWNANRHEQGVTLNVVLPGVRKDAVKVTSSEGTLQLEADRDVPESRGTLIHGQPAPDRYELKLRVGRSLDTAAANANLENGILRLEVPLAEAAKPQQIRIQ